MAKAKMTEVARRPAAGLPVKGGAMDFAAEAGRGMEGTTNDSFAIPFLSILQKGSPQVDEASGAVLKGAKAGMIYETVSKKLHDGKAGVIILPCAYKRTFLRWGARDNGGGFKGEFTPEAVAKMRGDGTIKDLENRLYFPMPDGSINLKKCDLIADHRNHFVLLIDEDEGTALKSLLSLKSTQIKKSKHLMSVLADIRIGPAGGKFCPPTYANKIGMVTVPEKNDDGTWYGVEFDLRGQLVAGEENYYEMARDFHASIAKGEATVKYDDMDERGELNAPTRGF